MGKLYKFEVEDIKQIDSEKYSSDEFCVARLGFLSTRPNGHKLEITPNVIKASAPSVLGKFVVADMSNGFEATTHTDKEWIQGYVPKEQSVDFVEDSDGYLRAYVDAVISKYYAKDFLRMFENDNHRAVSVEMKVETPEDDDYKVEAFNIVGVTVLGMGVMPSCPQSDIVLTRFSEDEAENYYVELHKLAEKKAYKIDKSKEAMSETAWGDVDKTELRNKVVEAENAKTLVDAVYMLVETDWETRPSEALKYPVMELKGDTFVYNRYGLSSALAYAKQEGEKSVVNKIEKIYKSLGLESDGKEETKMAEEIKKEEMSKQETECAEEEDKETEHAGEESEEASVDFEAKCAELSADIESKDNIIMEKDKQIEEMSAELNELKKYKNAVELERKTANVNALLADVKGYVTEEKLSEMQAEGMACDNFDAWSNSVKAFAFEASKSKKNNKGDDELNFAAPISFVKKEKKSIWDKI